MFTYIARVNRVYRRFQPFNDHEAWSLFKLAAIAEAVGWTLLIIGVSLRQLPVDWHDIPVAIAGRIHGMLFIAYIMAVLAFGSSLGWSVAKTILAGLCSVPPYGSLLFEQWEARRRAGKHARTFCAGIWYRQLLDDGVTM